ncbi:ATP-dependent 3'-5' DNA helicase [Coemansia guatemalensis]|uniref:ATP-dependent 3'-5' DNA helicase n=1 Tax=Coemansia guatemalensis TaxID=2761395 RepID=A0A9W8LRS4_9FUNG|nr:ATP-dependent 3'-5' DNA helicase [Coemansia guatemalensis]
MEDHVARLRHIFKSFATVSVFLSLKSDQSETEFAPISKTIHQSSGYKLTEDDLGVFRGLVGVDILDLFWKLCEEEYQLFYTLRTKAIPTAVQKPANGAKRQRIYAEPVQMITTLVGIFNSSLDSLQKEHSTKINVDNALQQMARNNLPPVPQQSCHQQSDNTIEDSETRPSVEQFLEDLRSQPFYHQQIVDKATRHLEASPARHGNLTAAVDSSIWTAISEQRGITQLYTHQAKAIDYILQSHSVVISTSTASGKSAIYQIPILQQLLDDPEGSTVLLLFPTKALAQDQAAALQQLFLNIPQLRNKMVSTLDGDTPSQRTSSNGVSQSERQRIRSNASVILTNPDTLHCAMLPNTSGWLGFWKRLKMVVIDELHIYQGQFGQHVGHILSRLQRFCSPRFIACSATTSNPQEHMQKLTNCSNVCLVSEDGSPHGKRTMLLWDSLKNIRHNNELSEGSFGDIANIAVRLLARNMRTIVFCKYRQTCELVFREINDCLREHSQLRGLQSQVMSYRGGYTATERRQIEQQLFSGALRMVVATSALELGIDVGSLDAVIMVGVPLSSASLWQQAGRAGRQQQCALAMVVATAASPFDRQALANPGELFARTFAPAAIATEPSIAAAHLHCAAFEMPISASCNAFVQQLGIDGTAALGEDARGLLWDAPRNQWCCALELKPWPPLKTPIRAVQQTEWTVVLATSSASPMLLLEELDSWHALFTLYEGGIFLHRGQTYSIDLVDPDLRAAVVSHTDVTWFTRPRDRQDAVPAAVDKSAQLSEQLALNYGQVDVTATVFGYRRVDARSKRVLEVVEHKSPSLTTSTKGIWMDIPLCIARNISAAGHDIEATIHAAQHAFLIALAAIASTCVAATDLGTECKSPMAQRSKIPRLIIYEKSACSSGPTLRALPRAQSILSSTLTRIEECLCDEGCTSCVFLTTCSEQNQCADKRGALLLLQQLCALIVD